MSNHFISKSDAPAYVARFASHNPSDADWDWRPLLDERQRAELELAMIYRRDFHHGTTGHNQLMLIDQLAEMLDFIFDHYKLIEGE